MSSRVSTVANRDLGQFKGLLGKIHVTIVQPGGGQADLGKVSAGALIGLSHLSFPLPPAPPHLTVAGESLLGAEHYLTYNFCCACSPQTASFRIA
jgi:hypothetical protein